MPKRIVPKDVLERHVENYEQLKAKYPGASKMASGSAQFVYNRGDLYIKKEPQNAGWLASRTCLA